MVYLDDWALIERNYVDSLSGAVEDLEASTLRLPVTSGAWVCQVHKNSLHLIFGKSSLCPNYGFLLLQADTETLEAAICSAVNVMKAMGTSIGSMLSRVRFLLM